MVLVLHNLVDESVGLLSHHGPVGNILFSLEDLFEQLVLLVVLRPLLHVLLIVSKKHVPRVGHVEAEVVMRVELLDELSYAVNERLSHMLFFEDLV